MLDFDLAGMYGIETKVLKQTVRRNSKRFPSDFIFELTKEEFVFLRSQIEVNSKGRGGTVCFPDLGWLFSVLSLIKVDLFNL